jgi:tRNA(Arg) A34 adenosine deaminase TadA
VEFGYVKKAAVLVELQWWIRSWAKREDGFDSPAFELMYTLSVVFGAQSLSYLRQPILINYEPTELCNGAKFVVGKRFRSVPSSHFDSLTNPSIVDKLPGAIFGSQRPETDSDSALFERPRYVNATLYDANGNILSQAWNTNQSQKVLHAEVNLIRNWRLSQKCKFPPRSKVVVSLKPCRMCAALLAESFEEVPCVYFEQNDEGPKAKNTLLDRLGLNQKVELG